MILYSGTPYWKAVDKDTKFYPKLNTDINCDVVVIGGGIAGCLTSYYLSQYNIDTVLIEKGKIANGTTCTHAGILQYNFPASLISLLKIMTKDNAIRSYKLCQKSMDDIEILLCTLNKTCGFERKAMLQLPNKNAHPYSIKRDFLLQKANSFPISYFTSKDIEDKFSFSYPCGIYSENNAIVDPIKFCHAILKAAYDHKGIKVYEDTSLLSYDYSEKRMRVSTSNGIITCKRIVFASGYNTLSLLKKCKVNLYHKYSIVTDPIKNAENWLNKCIIQDSSMPSISLRVTPDNRILCEGMKELYSQDNVEKDLTYASNSLLGKVKSFFPRFTDLNFEYSWMSLLGETEDTLPYIGAHPNYPNCYFNLNLGSNSIASAMIGAQIIKDLILYNSAPDAAIFSLNR